MSTLEGKLVSNSYKQLLKMAVSANEGVSASLINVQTGDGVNTALQVATNQVLVAGKFGVSDDMSVSGNLQLTGKVCASTFFGDGTNLTGVTATIEGNISVSNIVAGGTLNVAGTTTLTGDLEVTDNVTLSSGNLGVTGTTTLTVSNITSPDDDGKSFYLESAFSSGTYDTTTGRGVGNALNGPLKTSTATLKVLPTVTVTSEPAAVTVGTGEVATFTSSATTSDPDQGALAFQWTVDGENVTDEGRRDALVGNYASGANTTTLEIKKTTVGVSTVQFNAFVDAEGFRIAAKSKGTNFTGVAPRTLVALEAFTMSGNLIKTSTQDIGANGAFTLDSDTFGSDYGIIQFHSPEDNYTMRMTLKAAKGADSANFTGGGGGTGVIDFRLDRNIEYKRYLNGFFRGIVVDDNDPLELQRVRVFIPEITNIGEESDINEFIAPHKIGSIKPEKHQKILELVPFAEQASGLFGEYGNSHYSAALASNTSKATYVKTKTDSKGKGFSAKLWSIDITGYNERMIKTETDASDPSWSSLLSK